MDTLLIVLLVIGAAAVVLLAYAIGIRVAERRQTVAGAKGGGEEFRRVQPRRQRAAVGEREPGAGREATEAATEVEREYERAERQARRSATVGTGGR